MKNILRKLLTKKVLGGILTVLFLFGSLFSIYIYNPRFIPRAISSAINSVGDAIVGQELAEKIDETRDEDGATTIRLLFNMNKEKNLEKHCEKKEEKGQVQEKCFKTFVNEEFGYSVEYPEGWEIYKSEEDSVSFAKTDDILILNEAELKSEDTDAPYTFGKTISISNLDNSDNLSLEEYVNRELLTGGEGSSSKSTTKNGIEGLYVIDKGPNRFGGGIGEYFVFKKETDLMVVWLDHEVLVTEKNEDLSNVFQGILNSIEYEKN